MIEKTHFYLEYQHKLNQVVKPDRKQVPMHVRTKKLLQELGHLQQNLLKSSTA